jgi:hypothetical protein
MRLIAWQEDCLLKASFLSRRKLTQVIEVPKKVSRFVG